jgi:hypothetical protein
MPFPRSPVSMDRMIRSVRRELQMRRIVYPQRVKRGEMNEAEARDEYHAMEAVLETLELLQSRRIGQGSLF